VKEQRLRGRTIAQNKTYECTTKQEQRTKIGFQKVPRNEKLHFVTKNEMPLASLWSNELKRFRERVRGDTLKKSGNQRPYYLFLSCTTLVYLINGRLKKSGNRGHQKGSRKIFKKSVKKN